MAGRLTCLRSSLTPITLKKKARCVLIAFPRSLAQRFRAVLRRCTDSTTAFRGAVVTLRTSRQGLTLEAVLDEAAGGA